MDKKRRRAIIALFLILSIGNFLRIGGHHGMSSVLFISVFAIGLLAGILISDLAHLYRNRRSDKDKVI